MAFLSQNDLARVYWISGSVCAGKTTVSSIIAERNGWNAYHADEWEDAHRERATPETHPTYHAVSRITGDDLWLRPLEEQIRTDQVGADEELDLILDDAAELLSENGKPLLIDGYIRPSRLLPLLPSKKHAFYLIATEHFLLEQYKRRPWIHDVLAKTTDKQKAWDNWMKRDLAAARSLQNEASENDMQFLNVDESRSINETVELIERHFLGI
jgi:hypothetical protein